MKLSTSVRPFGMEYFTGPALNVLFTLVFFFLMASNLVLPSGVKITMPESTSVFPSTRDAAVLTITCGEDDQLLYLDGHTFHLHDLHGALEGLHKRTRYLIVRADTNTSYATMMRVCNEALKLGFETFLATAKPGKGS